MPLLAQRYTNPVVARPLADVSVVRTDDGYLAVGGGPVGPFAVELLRSPDLVRWVSAGGILRPVEGATGHRRPCLARCGDRWWLTLVVDRRRGPRVLAASAPAPDGPFDEPVEILAGLDGPVEEPFLLVTEDGTCQLFVRRGGAIDVVPMVSPTGPPGRPVRVLAPDAAWRTVRRPFVVRRDGRYHLFHSGALRDGPAGGIGHAVADAPAGPWVRPAPGARVLRPGAAGVGEVGGPSVVTGPDGGDVLAYEARVPSGAPARLCVDPLRWTPDGPVVDGPTWWETSLPR